MSSGEAPSELREGLAQLDQSSEQREGMEQLESREGMDQLEPRDDVRRVRAAVEEVSAGASETSEEPLFRFDVGSIVGKDFALMGNDVLRMLCIQLSIQILVAVSSPAGTRASTLLVNFLLLMAYVVVGVMLYWCVVRRLVAFA